MSIFKNYPYITTDNLQNKQDYNYTDFIGVEFLEYYFNSRLEYLLFNMNFEFDFFNIKESNSLFIFNIIDNESLLFLFIKTFEVNKCLYDSYSYITTDVGNVILKPNKDTSRNNALNYLIFAGSLIKSYQKSGNLIFINTLLKLNDLLISIKNKLELSEALNKEKFEHYFKYIISSEVDIIAKIISEKFKIDKMYFIRCFSNLKNKISNINFDNKIENCHRDNGQYDIKNNIDFAMIYAITDRSLIYLQSMIKIGIIPTKVIVLIKDSIEKSIAKKHLEMLERFNLSYDTILCEGINDDICYTFIAQLEIKYILYSGYGGEILSLRYFLNDKRFIHIHAGSLPDYRGSTTCYYQLLNEGRICATAMFLNEKLDEGSIVAEYCLDKNLIKEMRNSNIDTYVEPHIRSMALLSFLEKVFVKRDDSEIIQNEDSLRSTYYRIHPVLKHLAILYCFQ